LNWVEQAQVIHHQKKIATDKGLQKAELGTTFSKK
jgi:hypothetical protein